MSVEIITQKKFKSTYAQSNATNFYLPHELSFFDDHFSWFVKKQISHGKHLGHAMHEGAETFHDNAPAEAIVSDQEVIVNEVKKLRVALKNAVVVEYPEPHERSISIGTLCLLDWQGDGVELCYIVGEPNGYRELEFDFDFTPVSVKSPVGSALIDRLPGEDIEVRIGSNRPTGIRVINVEQQAWPLSASLTV